MDIKNFYDEEVKFLMLKFIPKKWKWKRNPYNLLLLLLLLLYHLQIFENFYSTITTSKLCFEQYYQSINIILCLDYCNL